MGDFMLSEGHHPTVGPMLRIARVLIIGLAVALTVVDREDHVPPKHASILDPAHCSGG